MGHKGFFAVKGFAKQGDGCGLLVGVGRGRADLAFDVLANFALS